MTDAVLCRLRSLPADALSAAELTLLHGGLPLDGPALVEFEELDAEAIALIEWGPEQPMVPAEIQPVRT